MAELISKDGVIKLIEKEFDMNCLTEWGQGYIDAMHDVKGIIATLPTVTEAEIRAKAIEEMVERIKIHTKVVGTTYLEDIDEIAEQLKGE